MRWLRPNADPRNLERSEVEDVARSLEASMADAPASPRMAEIRAALLEEVESIHHPALALRALALAAVVLLAVAVAVGAPVVGSYLQQLDDASPTPVLPEPEARADDLVTPTRSLTTRDEKDPVASGPPSSSQPVVEAEGEPAASVAPSEPPEAVQATPSVTPTPVPTSPPVLVPTPPIPVPTPPIVPVP